MKLSNVWPEFIALFRESVITQSLLTLGTGGVILYLYAIQQPVPDTLLNLFWALTGTWIGGKIALAPVLKRKG